MTRDDTLDFVPCLLSFVCLLLQIVIKIHSAATEKELAPFLAQTKTALDLRVWRAVGNHLKEKATRLSRPAVRLLVLLLGEQINDHFQLASLNWAKA